MSGYDDGPRRGGFNLDNYNTVPERMTEAFAKYPTASLQSDIVTLPAAFADKFIAVKARFFRFDEDPHPGEGMAWELVPGKTPYTKDSELMNAETSAWGRAIVAAFAADARKGIVSREEVAARQTPPRSRRQNPPRATETAPNGVDSETGEIDLEAKQWEARQKLRLLEAVGGDKAKAKSEWEAIVGNVTHSTGPPDQGFRERVEDEVGLVLVANLPPDQAPFT